MPTVLITGASGFIGRHALAKLIEAGTSVHAVARTVPAQRDSTVKWHAVDLLDQRSRRSLVESVKPEVIVHFAWETSHDRIWDGPSNLEWLAATVDLLRVATEHGLMRFVGLGSCAEYDPDADQPCRENRTPIRPRSLYGASKDACRRMIEAFACTNDIEWAWARVFYPVGMNEKPGRLVPSVATALLNGQEAEISSGRAVRDVIDVRDAGAAVAAVTLSAMSGPVNIGSGVAMSMRQITELLAEIIGRPDLIRIGALPDRTSEPPVLTADITLLAATGFHATKPIRQTLSDVVRQLRGDLKR